MGKFFTGLLVGCLIGYWSGVHYPDAPFRKYLPFDKQSEKVCEISYKPSPMDKILEDQKKGMGDFECKMTDTFLYELVSDIEKKLDKYEINNNWAARLGERYTSKKDK